MSNRISKITDTLFLRHSEFVPSEKQEKGVHVSTHSRLPTFTKQPPQYKTLSRLCVIF